MLPSMSVKESPRGSTDLRKASTVLTDSLYLAVGAASPSPTVPSAPVNSTTTTLATLVPVVRAIVQTCASCKSTCLHASFISRGDLLPSRRQLVFKYEDALLIAHHDVGIFFIAHKARRDLGSHTGVVINQVRNEFCLAFLRTGQLEPVKDRGAV